MNRNVAVALVAGLLLWSSPPLAHHSQVAVYHSNTEQKIEGELVQVMIRSPHSWVHVEAKDEKGEVQRFAIEWGGTAQLTASNITRESLKVGDKVVIVGRPSRVPSEYRVLMVNLLRPSDGFTWGRGAGEVVD